MAEQILPLLPPHIRDNHNIEPSDCNWASLGSLGVGVLGLATVLGINSLQLANQDVLYLLTATSAGSVLASIKFTHHRLRIEKERARETSTRITRARLRNLFAQPQAAA